MEMMIQQYEKAKVIQDEQLERLTQICQEQGVKFSYVFIYAYLVKANQTVHVLCCELSFEKYHWDLCCRVTGLSAKEALAAARILSAWYLSNSSQLPLLLCLCFLR